MTVRVAFCRRCGHSQLWSGFVEGNYLGACIPCWATAFIHNRRVRPVGGTDDRVYWVSAVMHTGFLSVVETPLHLARLRGDNDEAAKLEATEARSKIFSTVLVPSPIDRVAARV